MVTVDGDFARFGDKSYAINKINSVEVRETAPFKMGCVVAIVGAAAAIAALAGLGAATSGDGGTAAMMLLFAAIFGWLCHWAYQRGKVRDYSLVLMTSSSEAQAFTSRNREEVDSLRLRIEKAMTGRPVVD